MVAAALVAGVLAGCSGGGGDEERLERSGRGASGDSRLLEPDEVERGGILRVGIERPPSFDPAAARTVPPTDLLLADMLFDGLTVWDPAAEDARPAIAARWEPSDDLTRWVFRLRPDVRFSDGSPVTAEDVVFSLERVRDQGAASPASVLLQRVRTVTVADEGVVRIELSSPMATLPLVLTNPALGIVPRSFGNPPVGSGPFFLETRDPAAMRLRRTAGRDVFLDGVDVYGYGSVTEAYDAFRAGQLDWSLVPADAAGDDGVSLTPFQAVLFYGINVGKAPFADRRLREALVRAPDVATITRRVYGQTMVPLAGVVPDGVLGAEGDACGGRCTRDLERAQELVEEAYAGAARAPVHVDFDAPGRQEEVAGGVAAGIRAAGWPVELRPRPFAEYTQFLVTGQQEVFRLGWTGGWPSADAYLVPLFRSGSPDNVLGFRVAEVDAVLDEAMSSRDADERADLLVEAERLIMERFPVIPIGQFRTAWVVSERVRSLSVAVTGTFDATVVSLAGD